MLAFKHTNSMHAPVRRGITLIEVMMSTMVVSLGILGLASLIPLGTHLTNRGTLADRVAIVGERALHELKIRGGLNPSRWFIPGDNDPTGTPGPNEISLSSARLPVRQPYMIDPMFFGGNYGTDVSRTKFPYSTTLAIGSGNTFYETNNKSMQMWRISLNTTPGSSVAMSLPQAKLGFQSDDDLAAERPSDGELPAFQTFFNRPAGAVAGGPNVYGDIKRQAEGDYSWMVMLVPEAYDQSRVSYLPSSNPVLANNESNAMQPPINTEDFSSLGRANLLGATLNDVATDEYTAHVLVTRKRAGGIPAGALATSTNEDYLRSERIVEIPAGGFLSSSGYSTGEVQIAQTGGTLEQAEDITLKISNGDWICLVRRLPRTTPSLFPRGDIYQWYRVVMVDEVVSTGTGFTRRLTINGPDWASLGGALDPTHAIIVDGVVGVYTKRVRLESQSPWSP